MKNIHLFLTVLEAEEVQDHVIADLVSGEGLICSQIVIFSSSMAEGQESSLGPLFIKGISTFHEGSVLMPNHLPKTHTSLPYHHIGNKYQHVNLEGNITFLTYSQCLLYILFFLKLIVFEFCKSMLSFSLYSDHSLSFLAYLLVPLPPKCWY